MENGYGNTRNKASKSETYFCPCDKEKNYILQFTLKEPWLFPRHEEHYGEADCNLYGLLFIYFGWLN